MPDFTPEQQEIIGRLRVIGMTGEDIYRPPSTTSPMNAAEARRVAEDAKTLDSYKYKVIKQMISNAAGAKKFELEVPTTDAPDDVVKQLRKEGFQVSYPGNSKTIINW